jgi:hypothetical protein
MKTQRSIATIWEEYPETYPSGVDVSRREASRITRGLIPKTGYELVVAKRIHNGHAQTMYVQNISNAVYRFRVYIDVCYNTESN